MKRRDHIIQIAVLLLGLCGLFGCCIKQGYPWLTGILISLVIVVLYIIFMEISWRASVALTALPYSANPNYRVLLPLAAKIALPLYLCLFCVACIPLFRWELWLLTGFPVLLLLSVPLFSIMEELKDRRVPRRLFGSIQLLTIAMIYLLGQLVAWGLVRLVLLE